MARPTESSPSPEKLIWAYCVRRTAQWVNAGGLSEQMNVIRHWILIVLLIPVGVPATAHETDQFAVPPDRQFADLGDFFNRWAYEAIRRGVDATNEQIRLGLARRRDPQVMYELQSPTHVTMAVRSQWPWSVTQIETFERELASPEMRRRYPGRVVAYGERVFGVYQFAFFPLDLREFAHLLFFSSTIKGYGTYLGTDKLGHFTDEGINYYFAYRKARDAGADDRQATAQAVLLGTDGFMSERGMLGMLANADYSNADLAGNFAGFLFYRNLTEPVMLKGSLKPPLLLRDGPYWKLAEDVRPQSGFFARFVSDHLDEALNPGFFDPLLRPGLRAGVRNRTATLLRHYCDERGRPRPRKWFDGKLEELSTYWGVDYGHLGTYDELVSIGSSCFPAVEESPTKVMDRSAQLASAVGHGARDSNGRTASYAATASWKSRAVVSTGAVPNTRDEFGRTPLHDAAAAGALKAVRALLDAGADARVADDYGTTPLHLACRRGHIAIARLLLERGADVNARSAAGATPLHEAALAGDETLVGLLLDCGARPDRRDALSRSPADIASRHDFARVTALLARMPTGQNGGGR